MAIKNYAYLSTETGYIENVLCIDDAVVADLAWPDGFTVVEIPVGLHGEWSGCGIGWSFINNEFIEPPPPPAPVQPLSQGTQTL